MKRAFFSCLILAAAAMQSSYSAGQETPATGPAGGVPVAPSLPPPTPTTAPAPPTPTTAPPAADPATDPAAKDLPALPPPLAPAAGTTTGNPLPTPPVVPSQPPTILGPGATNPPATGGLLPPAGDTAPPSTQGLPLPLTPQDPSAEGIDFLLPDGGSVTSGLSPRQYPRYIASQNVTITWSERKDAAWGYSKSVGRWAKQSLDPPATKAHEVPILTNDLVVWSTGTAIYGFSGTLGRWSKQSLDPPATKELPALNDSVAVLQVGATFYGFSGAAARWDVLQLPAESKATFAVDDEYALVTDREDLYTFSAATGRWSSPQDATSQIGDGAIADASGTSGASEVRTFQLQHANAVTLEQTLLRQLFADELRLGANHTGLGDTIIARGKPEALDQLEALLKVLDRPASAATGAGTRRGPSGMGSMSGSPGGNVFDDDLSGLSGDMRGSSGDMMGGMSGMPGGMPAGPASRTQLLRAFEQAERRAAELAKQLRENQPRGGSGQSPAALEQAVAQAFAARQNLHQHDLAALENRLQSTRETLSMRERIKQQIVERRVSDLLNPNLEWDAPPTAAATAPPASTSVESPTNPQGLLALQAQTGRFHKLQERWDVVFELYKGGRVDIGEALRAAAEVHEAEAAIASSPAVGVQAAERHVERTRGLQEIVEAKFRNEVEPVQAKLAAEAAVLNAEAILANAQDTANRLSTRPATPLVPAAAMNPALYFANNLRGTWLQVAQERNGERTYAKPETIFTLTFDGNRYTLRQGTEKYASGTFKVGGQVGYSRELDTVRTWLKGETEETQRPQQELGLANLDQYTLQWCYGGLRANERPDRLATKKDDGRLLTEWRRFSEDPLSDEQFRSIDLEALTETVLAPSSNQATRSRLAPPTAIGEAVRVRLTGLERVTCVTDVSDAPGSRPATLSMTSDLSIRPGYAISLMLSKIPGRGQLQLSAHLAVPALSARASQWAAHNNIPLQFTSEDLDQAAAANDIVKVVYLPHETPENKLAPEAIVSTRLGPGVDAVEEAKKRGDVLVAVTLSNVVSAAEESDRNDDLSPAAARSPSSVPSAETNRIFAGDSPLILGRPEDLRSQLSRLYHQVQSSQLIVDRTKQEFAAGNADQRRVDNALADLRSWQNKLDLAKAEYAAQMKLLDSNLHSAEIAADAAQKSLDRATKLFERGVTPASALDDARREAQETEARVQRAKTLLELYRRVDELSRPATTEPQPNSPSPTKPTPTEPTPTERAAETTKSPSPSRDEPESATAP